MGETLGQHELRKVAMSLSQLAKLCGVSRASVSNWRNGKSRPHDDSRAILQRELGIPAGAWDVPASASKQSGAPKKAAAKPAPAKRAKPGRTSTAKTAAKKAKPKRAKPPEPKPEPDDWFGIYPRPPAPDAPQLEHIKHSLRCVRQDLQTPDLSPSQRSKIRQDEARLVSLVLKLEGEREMREERYVKAHPAWQELYAVILSALEPYPDAARAVAEALQE